MQNRYQLYITSPHGSMARVWRGLLVLMLVCSLAMGAYAQERYTLTNGTQLWHRYLKVDHTDRGTEQVKVYDSKMTVVPNAGGAEDTLIDLEQGQIYLELDLSDTDNPKVRAHAKNDGDFSPKCVWLRTGSTGYYYQDWDGYRYYLRGNNLALWVDKMLIGEAITNNTYWYDWDFGAAMQETSYIEGSKKNAYYWIMYDGSQWKMSCDSYERPETIIYRPSTTVYTLDDTALYRHYSCEMEVDGVRRPTGHGALFMPVERIVHPAEVDTTSGSVGLTGLMATASDGTTPVDILHYGDAVRITPQYVAGNAMVTPEYIEYREEQKRTSIALKWYNRNGAGVGVPELKSYFYQSDDATSYDVRPVGTTQTLALVRVEYNLDHVSQRYLSIEKNSDADSSATLRYDSYCHSDRQVEVEVVYTYSYGSTGQTIAQRRKIKLPLSSSYSGSQRTVPSDAPLVRGAVFGGGRMANVGKTTRVSIYNCDTISAVYGGNDISGRVLSGSTVRIGVEDTTSIALRIGSVYGGGNGYYNYPDISTVGAADTLFTGAVKSLGSSATEVASGLENAYLPDIQSTRVVVNDSLVVVDTIFGGSRNAFVAGTKKGVASTADTLIRVEFLQGTAFAVFGGNNVGGTIANTAPVSVVLKGSNRSADTNIANTWFSGYGRDFGIRYLFGGGNKVDAPKVVVKVAGGMVDTAFGGGNLASVTEQVGVSVDCPEGKVIYNNKTTANPDKWLGGMGRYNVRTLFGGNNRADMAIVPQLTLVSGGVGNVYGGGNAGDMICSADVSETKFTTDFVPGNAHFTYPQKLSTYVHIPSGSKIKIDYLFGGCQLADVLNSTYLLIEGGEIGTVYGGCNVAGDVGSKDFETNYSGAYVIMKGGQVYNSVFGGSAGNYHCTGEVGGSMEGQYVEGMRFGHNNGVPFDPFDDYLNLPAPTLNATYLYLADGTINGNVYGGGMMANVGHNKSSYKHYSQATGIVESTAPMRQGEVHITLDGVEVKRNVYGGGNSASVYGLSYMDVKGTTTISGSLFAGNDKNGSVEAFGKYVDRVNNKTDAEIMASDGTPLNTLEGGSYNRGYTSYVKLEGTPTIGCVYGGGNGAYNYNGTEAEQALYGDQLQLCRVAKPIQTSSFVDINVSGGAIDTVFGGGNGVGVSEGVLVLLKATETAQKHVHTIFGGNNRDNMEIVPDIKLLAGKVGTVYGGCNAGNLSGRKTVKSVCGDDVPNVATYILVDNVDVTVDTAIFGGCKQASIIDNTGIAPLTTFVDIRKTSTFGVNYVYGGSDMSGEVENTRVDVSGGVVKHIYGGSNGYYDYKEMADDDFTVYEYGHAEGDASLALHTLGEPTVGNTVVNIMGGIIESSVFGGGRMGECENTHVVVNDQMCGSSEATIHGTVYGGGQGDYEHLNLSHRGNVTTLSQVDLYHVHEVSEAKAYGGGQGGDVYNTLITTHPAWDQPFDELYGGCWGSDVLGTATVEMNGNTSAGNYNVRSLFGGNDKTGNVYRSVININSGKFANIYGAGNGNYADTYSSTFLLPNNEYVELNINGGDVSGNVYGGGMLGTVWRTQKATDGTDKRDANNLRIADTSTIYPDPEDYAHIFVNLHDGVVHGNVYAGGAGSDKLLVYGLKMLNMDGGEVFAVYGGSENVSDGYRQECNVYTRDGGGTIVDSTTTMRPSSILNIVGGTVSNNVYGGGYLGNVYGSVYINIGLEAVRNSTVWANTYGGGVDSTYKRYMPGYKGSFVDELTTHVDRPLKIGNSVYGGANWGENSGNALFNKRGFYGGEGRILVDGKGYNTREDAVSTEPLMDIYNSIIGAGTSAMGGDILCRIDVQNYGGVGTDCSATKELYAIQRADQLWLRNTAIRYLGSSDASSVYTSQMFTVNRIDTVSMRGYNVMELDAVMTNIYHMNYYEDDLDAHGDLVPTSKRDLYVNESVLCADNVPLCDQLATIDPVSNKHSALVVNNGVNVDVYYPDKYVGYGEVRGFGYLMAQHGTNAVVMARAKYGSTNKADGGYMSVCSELNQIIDRENSSGYSLEWKTDISDTVEFPYNNFSDAYRVWKMGNGKRVRYAVILAHATPKTLYTYNRTIRTTRDGFTSGSDSAYLSLAHAELRLPPTDPGHYYKLSPTNGIVFSNDNTDPMNLVDSVWAPDWNNTTDSVWGNDANAVGSWKTPNMEVGNESMMLGLDAMYKDPANTYGLLLASGENFDNTSNGVPPGHTEDDGIWGSTPITGNSYATFLANFASSKVASEANTSPVMDLFLTYNNQFATTTVSTVKFTLQEWNEGVNLGSDINVVVTISTVIDSFRDVEYDVLAMYNEGTSNTFERKVILPATLQHRELYLDSVEWFPISADGTAVMDNNHFLLTGDEATITTSKDNNRFSLAIQPVDNISATATSSVGWHSVSSDMPTDIYSSVKIPATGLDKVSAGTLPDQVQRLRPLEELIDSKGRGLMLGELDGRGLAALKLMLTFNGNNIYPKNSYVGRVNLTMSSYVGGSDMAERFHITVNVYCRENGDTIYIASTSQIPKPSSLGGGFYTPCTNLSEDGAGKSPSKYLQTFTDALRTGIYREGDVICVLDTVRVTDGDLTIQGADYSPITVMRYDGHHRELPGDDYVYRGTMVSVSGASSSFSTRSINFDGTMLSKVLVPGGSPSEVQQPLYLGTDLTGKYADTNSVYGPVIAVRGGATVSLGEGTTVNNNWNNYTGSNAAQHGAISVTGKGTLALANDVTINHNINALNGDACSHPMNGAVYVNNGTVELLESNRNTKVLITDNYLMDGTSIDQFWTNHLNNDSKLVRLKYDGSLLTAPANVLLTRTEASAPSNDDVHDAVSDQVVFSSSLPSDTRIGISKWFPGEDVRDTISFALQPSANYIQSAYLNGNFQSDCDAYDVFYNYGLNNQRLYLHRCATFRFQQPTGAALADGSEQGKALLYNPNETLGCPTGGDTLFARVKGGFFPYKYTWKGSTPRSRNTGVANNVVNQQMNLSTPDYTYYRAAMTDTLITSNMNMHFADSATNWVDTLTVTDLAGCRQVKRIDVRVAKVNTVSKAFEEKNTHWASADTGVDVTAIGRREFTAIHITPLAWADRNAGTITAVVEGPDNDYIYQQGEDDDHHELSDLFFCQGDVIKLATRPGSGMKFVMWDFDPYYSHPATYVVPALSETVTAYFGPGDYWVDHVNSLAKAHAVYDETFDYVARPNDAGGTPASYVTTYRGDVHIYDEEGLAWFISVVNGLNGTQARPFYFNRVLLHQKTDGTAYDMQAHLWTPVGTRQHPFRGWFLGVGPDPADTTVLAAGNMVTIKNIIVNEPNANYTGFFGFLDAATVRSIKFEGALVRGAQYVGAVAASSKNSRIWNCEVTDQEEGAMKPTTILSTHYASGGVVALSESDTIQVTGSAAKYVGDAVYSGGIVGYGTSSKIRNSWTRNYNSMEGLYIGGVAGYLDGVAPYLPTWLRAKSAGNLSVVENNYVYLTAQGAADRVGGLVGYAENTMLRNNYVYGDVRGRVTDGAVSGAEGDNMQADENYYATAALAHSDASATAFSGAGNQVLTNEPVRGLDNLTRLLNRWVREQGEGYLSWRSDLEGTNNGYPIFGQPDLIPVRDSMLLSGCGEVEYAGVVYDTTQTVMLHVVDSTLMVDSVLMLRVEVSHGARTALADSATVGVDYEGYGFRVSAAESQLLRATIDSLGSATLVLYDTIAVEDACDSIVSLRLTFTLPTTGVQPTLSQPEAKVYPNPTTSVVHVECEGVEHVELYDAEGRRVSNYLTAANQGRITVDMSRLASGSYYLRIHVAGTAPVIQKIIKK